MRLFKFLSQRNLTSLIDVYSNFNPSPMSLKKLTDFGWPIIHNKNVDIELVNKTETKSFEFLRQELLVRLAAMTKEILYLPDKLVDTSYVQKVYGWYMKSFAEVVEFREATAIDKKTLKGFTDTLNNIVNRHSEVVPTIAMGILQLQETYGIDKKTEQSIQYFLDRFLTSRISIRMLINQHILMFGPEKITHPGHIGAIHTKCDVGAVLRDAYDNAKFLCEQNYLCSPSVDFIVDNSKRSLVMCPLNKRHVSFKNILHLKAVEKDVNIEFLYVPSHLYHMAFELYKNAMRAILEFHGQNVKEYPKIKTLIVKSKEDITIRITDNGGGIPRSKIPLVFKYMYTTAPKPSLEESVYSPTGSPPMAGFGYGLPLSRLYARYFNGDLILSSIDGHSTDAYIYLKTISSEASESLPVHNSRTVNTYKDKREREHQSDWTDTKRSLI